MKKTKKQTRRGWCEQQTHPRAVGGRVIHYNCQFNCQRAAGHEEFFSVAFANNKNILDNLHAGKKTKKNIPKQKRAAETRCGTMCLRGMQRSLRHVFVCSTCKMGYLLRSQWGRRSTPLCGHKGDSSQGRGADHLLRPCSHADTVGLKAKQSPHTKQSVSRNCCIWCAQTPGKEPTGNMIKGGNPFGLTPLLPAFCLLWWLFRAACRRDAPHLAEPQARLLCFTFRTQIEKVRHKQRLTRWMCKISDL